MDDSQVPASAPLGWIEALARSEAELAAGKIVPGEEIMRELHVSAIRLEGEPVAKQQRGRAPQR